MKSRMLRVELSEGHDWKDVAPGWLRGNEYAGNAPTAVSNSSASWKRPEVLSCSTLTILNRARAERLDSRSAGTPE
jgi:hypothetical protein